jgi:uncharacterized protein (TIGR02246 family)
MWTVVRVPGIEGSAAILRGALDEWKAGIDAHDPGRVAAAFTADAVFQGLRPHSVGRPGVAEYYDGQPLGMTVDYRIAEVRRVGADAVLGYLAADFSYPDRDPVHVTIGVLAVRTTAGWRIGYYQASPAPQGSQPSGTHA